MSVLKIHHQNKNEALLVLLLLIVVPLLQSFLSKLVSIHDIAIIRLADEIALLFLSWTAIKGFKIMFTSRLWIGVFFFYSIYFLLAYVSALIEGVPISTASQQALISFKYIFVLSVLLGIRSGLAFVYHYITISKAILILSMLLYIWQFVFPSGYDAVFAAGYHKNELVTSVDVGIARGAGFFSHPGQMALFSGSFFLLLLFIGRDYLNMRTTAYRTWLIVCFVALVLTFSRLELVATVTAIMVASLLFIKKRNNAYRVVILGLLVLITGLALHPLIGFYLNFYIGSGIAESTDPRMVFMLKGIDLAISNFPLGSGFGTFGGYVAYITNSSLYPEIGFNDYSWFHDGKFLTDTYWSHVLGESGVFGFISLIISVGLIVRLAIKISLRDPKLTPVSQAIISGTVLLALNSFTTPDMVSVLSLSQCLIGVAILSQQRQMVSQAAPSVSTPKQACLANWGQDNPLEK